ncbi:MAG: hypothetical protein JJU11_10485 [Candidatus Sumerlaeia bacterium]|nr:hypothetical protein [Candidatus Sumerlaeia bacterium]
MNPLDRLRYNRRQRLENLAGVLVPWLLVLVGYLGAHLLIDELSRHERVMHLATIQVLVLPVVMGYVIQLTSIRRFENLLRRIPWDEMRLTLLTGHELHQWAAQRWARCHVVAFLITFLIVWAAILWDSWEVVPRLPLLLLLLAALVGTPLLLVVSVNIGFHHLLRPGVGYFRARAIAFANLTGRWGLLLGAMALLWFVIDLDSYMGRQMVYQPSTWLIGGARILLWVLLIVMFLSVARFVAGMVRGSGRVIERFDRALQEEW